MLEAFTQEEFVQVFRQFMPTEEAIRTARQFGSPVSAQVQPTAGPSPQGVAFSTEPSEHYSRDLLILLARVSPSTAVKVEHIRDRLALQGDPDFATAVWQRRQAEIEAWFSSGTTRPEIRWTGS